MKFLLTVSLAIALAAPPVMARSHGGGGGGGQSAIVWNNRGVDLYAAGRYSAAIAAYDKAIKINPRYTDAYSNRGVAYDAMNQPERAVIDYSKAIALNPSSIAGYVNRGLAYTDLAKFNEAIADWNLVLRRSPRNADALYRRGFCYQSLGSLNKALSDYDKACHVSPRFAKAVRGRDTMRKALAITPATTATAQAAFTPLPMEKQPVAETEGTEPSSKMARRVEHDAPSLSETAMSLNHLGPESTAVHRYGQRIGASAGAFSVGQFLNGSGTFASSQSGKSNSLPSGASPNAQVFSSPSSSQPESAGAEQRKSAIGPAAYSVNVLYHVIGNSLYTLHQYDAAAACFSGALSVNPSDHWALFRRGNAYFDSGRRAMAAADYLRAVELDPKFKPAQEKFTKLASEAAAR